MARHDCAVEPMSGKCALTKAYACARVLPQSVFSTCCSAVYILILGSGQKYKDECAKYKTECAIEYTPDGWTPLYRDYALQSVEEYKDGISILRIKYHAALPEFASHMCFVQHLVKHDF